MARLARLTEQGFIDLIGALARPARERAPSGRRRAVPARVLLGIGDDAAVLTSTGRRHLLVTSDILTDGVHFHARWTPPRLLGRKVLAVNLSDIAAMGGLPVACVLTAGLPRATRAAYAEGVARGIAAQARRFGVQIVGGDTGASRALTFGATLLGVVEPGREIRRGGARPGDGLYVTGSLGASTAGLHLLRRGARLAGRGARSRGRRRAALLAHLDPAPRVLAGRLLGLSGLAAAMIDLSDGLAQDLPRLCAASGTGAVVEESALPVAGAAIAVLGPDAARRAAVTGGEDYELLFSARAGHEAFLRHLSRRLGLPLSRIGQITPPGRGVRLLTRGGRYLPFEDLRGGFRHFPADA